MATEDSEVRAARNESLLRELNEQLKAHNASHTWVDPPVPDWVCECATETCMQPVHASITDYEAIRANGSHFLIAPDHASESIERVVRMEEAYWVVEKVGIGAEVSEILDPRSDEEETT